MIINSKENRRAENLSIKFIDDRRYMGTFSFKKSDNFITNLYITLKVKHFIVK